MKVIFTNASYQFSFKLIFRTVEKKKNVSVLGSFLTSPTDLYGIETQHSLFDDFKGDQTLQLIIQAGDLKFQSKLEAPALILHLLPQAVPEGN